MKILLFACCLFIISCQTSLSNKFESKIKDGFNGEKIEHIKIDSLRYSIGDASEFANFLLEDNDDYKTSLIKLYNTYRGSLNDKAASVMHDIMNNDRETEVINKLPELIKDSIYNVDYYIDYQTDNFSYAGHKKSFYFKKDLSPFHVNVDSIMKLNKDNFDSLAILNSLNLNDSLIIARDNLHNEMINKIALGTTEMNKLDYQLRIAKINVLIADNQAKYPFLF